MNKPATIWCGGDVPVRVREGLEQNEILAASEQVLLFHSQPPKLLGWRQKRHVGYILTNFRLFYYTRGKVGKYIFLNNIRKVTHKKRSFRDYLSFQLVDGSIRELPVYQKQAALFLIELFDAMLNLDFAKIDNLLISDRRRIRQDIFDIMALNVDLEFLFANEAQRLWKVTAYEGERLEDIFIRLFKEKKQLRSLHHLWEERLHVSAMRKELLRLSREAGLQVPAKWK